MDPLPLDVEEDLQENDYHANTLYQAVRVLVPWVQGEEGSSSEGKCKYVMSNACQQWSASQGLVSRIFVANKILDILPL